MTGFGVHGGRLSEARRRFPAAPSPWLDLSTGINPHPYPAAPAGPEARARLPDPEDLARLEACAGAAFGCGGSQVLATPGAQAAIGLLARVLPAAQVGVLGPTYAGHAQAWRAAGAAVTLLAADALEVAADTLDAVVVVNPNNPDGARTAPPRLAALAAALARRGGRLIVDEAFVEAAPELSVVGPTGPPPGSVVLRSFGKFYGLAGLRLGFVVADAATIGVLRARLGEWPVGADAIAAGLAAYPDRAWAETALAELQAGAVRLDGLLRRTGFAPAGGCALFRLAQAADAPRRFQRLARLGVLTRPFDHAPAWLRFGLPVDEHWPRLEAALMESAR